MPTRKTLVIGLLLLVVGFITWKLYAIVPWIDIARQVHAERGAINWGHVLQSQGQDAATAAINCALAAHQERRPFTVAFTVWGTDEQVSNAVIGDSRETRWKCSMQLEQSVSKSAVGWLGIVAVRQSG